MAVLRRQCSKLLPRKSEFWIDFGVTGDAARILRVPGTYNRKYGEPRPVRLLEKYCPGTQYNFEQHFQTNRDVAGRIGSLKVAPAFAHLEASRNIAEGIVLHELPPVPFAPVKEGCAWLREAHETGGKDFDEPQWNLTTYISLFLEDGHALAHAFGNQHPDYSVETTDDKRERKDRERRTKKSGMAELQACSRNWGKPHCAACPHFAEGKSPLNLGLAAARACRQ